MVIFSAITIIFLSGCGTRPEGENEYATSTVGAVKPSLPAAQNACEEACLNYVDKCLTLVPNADNHLFQDGKDTCEEDCANWDEEKTQCMIDAKACTEMTDVCDL